MIKIHPDTVKVIDRWLNYNQKFNKILGISVGVVVNNKTLLKKGYGFSNFSRKIKTGQLTTYRIASISKVFTGIGILKLVQQKKLKLEDPVIKFIPSFAGEKSLRHKKITIKQLLTHKSLLARDGSYGQWETRKFPTTEKLLNQTKENMVFLAPETKWKYSNFGYSILGQIIEQASGLSYEEFIQKTFIKPLGLKHTSSILNKNISNELATGYVPEFPGSPLRKMGQYETYAMAAATGLSSNTSDLIEFMKAIINRSPKLLNKQLWDIAFKKQWSSKSDQRNLLLWEDKKTNRLGHGGGFPGFATRISIDLKKRIGVTVLINMNPGPSGRYLNGIYSILEDFPKLLKNLRKIKAKPEAVRYEGRFKNLWGIVEVLAIDGQLVVLDISSNKPLEEAAILEYTGDDTFVIHDYDGFGSNGELVKFIFSKNRKLLGMNWAGHYHKFVS